MLFNGKTVAITGAAGGIGQSLCRHFASEGASIAAIDLSPALHDFAAALAKEGVSIRHAIADVGDPAAVAKAFAQLGSIDILINNSCGSSRPVMRGCKILPDNCTAGRGTDRPISTSGHTGNHSKC